MEAALASIFRQIWTSLHHGVKQGASPYRLMQLATVARDGAPKSRTIVLRAADEVKNTVSFHTDRRSAKIAEMLQQPRIALTAVDLPLRQQVRVEGVAQINAEADERLAVWDSSPPHTRQLYQSPRAPGSVIDTPEQAYPSPEEDGLAHFAWVSVVVSRIEWLDLRPDGHRRVVFQRVANKWEARRTAP